MNNIKWNFWDPSSGKDEKGNKYLRVNHCSIIAMALIKTVIAIVIINFIITQTIDTYSHPDMTRTRVFLRTPQTFLWNFR